MAEPTREELANAVRQFAERGIDLGRTETPDGPGAPYRLHRRGSGEAGEVLTTWDAVLQRLTTLHTPPTGPTPEQRRLIAA